MGFRIAAVIALLLPAAALAADPAKDKPIIGPPAGWVRPPVIPTDTAKPDQSAIRVLLSDQQVNLLPNGSEVYNETAIRVQTAQGLPALGTISIPWRPDRGTITVHKLQIIRNGKVIDLLAGGSGFTVLRRENGLEYAMLDGVLTAVIQPEGLQVGDVLDMATTIQSSDPVLGGNSETLLVAGPAARAARWSIRAQWPSSLPVQWREADGLPPIKARKAGGLTEIAVSLDNVEPVILPKEAPPRFALTRMIEASTLASWNQMSALFAPLYAKAAMLKADSPLKAEVARIAAISTDPARRAEAALALVQDQVRYVFLGMNDGSLVPADADLSWQRRFADCKGKTALLIALLHELGIQAEAALVSTALGDGLNERLPMVGLFDHVIVRATIAGKVYWLDGTRTGDLRLADIQVPNFRYALPLRPAGAPIETLDLPVPAKPLAEYGVRIDMSGGVTLPFPFHIEEISRGDEALTVHLRIDNMTPEVRQQALRDYFAGRYPDVEVKTFTASWDPATGEEKLVMDGLEKHDWRWAYEVDHAGLGWKADFERPAGQHRDAPYAVGYPYHVAARTTILLPNGGRGFLNRTTDVDKTVAAVEYHRKAKLDGATFTVETRARAIGREFPASAAPAAQATLRELAAEQPLLALTSAYESTAQERQAILSSDPKSAFEFFTRGKARAEKKDFEGALADFGHVIDLEPASAEARFARASVYGMMGKLDEAQAEMEKAVALAPANVPGHLGLAQLLLMHQRQAEALAEVDKAVALAPKDPHPLALRAELRRQAGRYDEALADSAAAIKLSPDNIDLYQTRINIFRRLHQEDKAIEAAQAAVTANPRSDLAHILLAATYARFHRDADAAAEFAKALAIKPSVQAYLTRANNRPASDLAGKRADIAAALKLDPASPDARAMAMDVELRTGNYAGAIKLADGMLANAPKDAGLLVSRGIALARSKRAAEARKDFAAVAAMVGGNAQALNNLCYEMAMKNVELDSALGFCDAALRISPAAANIVDSRAFVLLRLGRNADAVEAYDKALALEPNIAASLYGRGLAKRRLGKAEADKDVAAAKAIEPEIDKTFETYGVTG